MLQMKPPINFYTSKRLKRFCLWWTRKQLIKEGCVEQDKNFALSCPSCVSFHSNIIIKTISLRKIIREIFRGRSSEKALSPLTWESIVICNYTILFWSFFSGSPTSALHGKHERTKGEMGTRILAPDWQMNLFCLEPRVDRTIQIYCSGKQ